MTSKSAAFSALRQARLLKDDTLLRCNVGPFQIAAVRSTNLQYVASSRWKWPENEHRRAWSACSNANLLIASFLSGEERVRARMTMGDKYIGATEAIALGEVRGSFELGVGAATAAPHVGNDDTSAIQLTVERILYGAAQPFSSSVTVPLSSALHDVQRTQLAYQEYLDLSVQEQCSRILLFTGTERNDGEEKEKEGEEHKEWSGGLMVSSLGHYGMNAELDDTVLVDAKEKDTIDEFSEWWDKEFVIGTTSSSSTPAGSSFMELSSQVGVVGALETMLSSSPLASFELKDVRVRSCDYYCRCTTDQFRKQMKMLPVSELVSIMNDMNSSDGSEPLDLICHHCNEKHPLTYNDLELLLTSS